MVERGNPILGIWVPCEKRMSFWRAISIKCWLNFYFLAIEDVNYFLSITYISSAIGRKRSVRFSNFHLIVELGISVLFDLKIFRAPTHSTAIFINSYKVVIFYFSSKIIQNKLGKLCRVAKQFAILWCLIFMEIDFNNSFEWLNIQCVCNSK